VVEVGEAARIRAHGGCGAGRAGGQLFKFEDLGVPRGLPNSAPGQDNVARSRPLVVQVLVDGGE